MVGVDFFLIQNCWRLPKSSSFQHYLLLSWAWSLFGVWMLSTLVLMLLTLVLGKKYYYWQHRCASSCNSDPSHPSWRVRTCSNSLGSDQSKMQCSFADVFGLAQSLLWTDQCVLPSQEGNEASKRERETRWSVQCSDCAKPGTSAKLCF